MEPLPIQQFINLNDAMAMRYLVDAALRVENSWDDLPRRAGMIDNWREFLYTLKDREAPTLRQLSSLSSRIAVDMSLKRFLDIVIPIERQYTRGVLDHEILVAEGDLATQPMAKIPLVVVLDNIRSAFNVGAIFRTAECLGVEKIYLCGYTSRPDEIKTKKTAMGTDKMLDWQWQQGRCDVLDHLRESGYKLIALETVKNCPAVHDYCFPQPMALILGNERYGLDKSVLDAVDGAVKINLSGRKNSLNVGVAFGICGFEIKRQWC